MCRPEMPSRSARRSLVRASTLAAVAILAACGPGTEGQDGATGVDGGTAPVIERFAADASSVDVGGRTRLMALFTGDGASVEGIGPVRSGVPIETPALARETTFVLEVHLGAQVVEARVTVAARYRDRLRALAPSPVARTLHLAMALPDGGALLMGGNTSETPNVPDSDTSQHFDPGTERLSGGPALAFSARAGFTTAARAGGGGILLVGAGPNNPFGHGASRADQVLDATGRFVRLDDLALDHAVGGAATSLGGGRVLVTGGSVPPGAGVEVLDPRSGQWRPAADLLLARRGHTATLLLDGRVLVVGGVTCCDASGEVLTAETELYDPNAGFSTPMGSLAVPRGFHEATLLADGRVLVTGGLTGAPAAPTVSAELWDPATGKFGPAGDLQVARVLHAAVLLTDGRVLVLGGFAASRVTELFDPASALWSPGPELNPAAAQPTATLLGNGKVLVFGGEDAGGFPVATAQLYE